MDPKYVYLDNAAASCMDEKVLEAMRPYFFDVYAVASSEFGYSLGIQAREGLDKARESLAGSLNAEKESFVFTSGSTESSNMALKGTAAALKEKKGKHLIVSRIEDFPVLHSARALERDGLQVTYLDVDKEGFVDLNQLRDSITGETFLVSIQHANQEIGTMQDIQTISDICQEKEVFFHTDATHTLGRVPLDVQKIPVDLATVSAHTIHGPKGIGGLYLRKDMPFRKWMDGGFQEFDRRAGTENIPGAVGFAKAVELITDEENQRIQSLRDRLINRVLEEIPDTTLNGPREKRLPQNANLTIHFVEGESITLHLDMRGFALSTGSACFSRSLEASHVITGIGGDHERAHGSLRFTFGRFNTLEDVENVVDALVEVAEQLRKISPLKQKKEES